jgi:hypothetical protein
MSNHHKNQASSFLARFKRQIEESPKKPLSHLPESPPNAFRSVFGIDDLDESQKEELKELLHESAPIEKDSHEVQRDFDLLKSITAEIRSIQKQSALLLGERIVKAREILKLYGDGKTTFTKWLDSTFSSRRTAYNCLAYYEFYSSLPNDGLRQRLKNMSHKAVYMLASRVGDLEQKYKIVEEYSALKQTEIIPIIQELFPILESEKKKEAGLEGDLNELERVLERLLKRKTLLHSAHRKRLEEIQDLMSELNT